MFKTYFFPFLVFLCILPNISCSDDLESSEEPQEVDLCENVECGENGECIDGLCECNVGFGGPQCQFNSNTDSLALVAFYNSTNGSLWKEAWDLNSPMDDWIGVGLNDERRVFTLNNIKIDQEGAIPSDLTHLSELEVLSISGLMLQDGGFMDNIHGLQKLRVLEIDSTNLGGQLPEAVGQLKSLEYLKIAASNLAGNISSSIGSLTNLEIIILSGNALSGDIPSELWNLVNLRGIILEQNELTGGISSDIKNLIHLEQFKVRFNNFEGNIPSELGMLPNMYRLDLGSNNFTGEIPASFGMNPVLKQISLYGNDLSGCIPSSLETFFCPLFESNYRFTLSNNPQLPWQGFLIEYCMEHLVGKMDRTL